MTSRRETIPRDDGKPIKNLSRLYVARPRLPAGTLSSPSPSARSEIEQMRGLIAFGN